MRLHNQLFITFSLLFLTIPSFANTIDSLLLVLRQASQPAQKIHLLLQLADKSFYDAPQKQLNYTTQAFEHFQQAKLNNDSLLAEVIFAMGSAYEVNNRKKEAIGLYNQADSIANLLSIPWLNYAISNSKGMVYSDLGEFDTAIENYQEALNIAEKDNDRDGISAACNNIAILYTELKVYDKAQELLEKSYLLSQQTGDEHGRAIALSNMADIQIEKENWDKAIEYFHRSLAIVDSLNLQFGILHTNLKLGMVYQQKEMLEISEQYCQKAYKMAKELGFKSKIGMSALGLAEIKLAEGDHLNSISKAKEALEFVHQFNSKKQVADVFKCLSKNYEAIGDFKMALQYQKAHEIQQDSFFDEEKIAKFSALEYQFSTKKKEAENTLLKAQMLKKEATIEQRTMMVWVIGLVLLMFGLAIWFLYYQNKQRHRYNQQLEQQVAERTQHLELSNKKLSTANQELEQFAYITSHDLKEPLRNISGFSSLIRRNIQQSKYENIVEYLEFISQNTRQMHALIEDILSFSKVSKTTKVTKTISLALILEKVKNDLQLLISEKKGQIVYEDPKLQNHAAKILLPFQISMVFKNLIENGLKYNKHGSPKVTIGYMQKTDCHLFTVQDNGIGIDANYHQKVFEMFKRLHHRGEYSGSGVGLAICKKVVQNLNGEIKIRESAEVGTVFELEIPVSEKMVEVEEGEMVGVG